LRLVTAFSRLNQLAALAASVVADLNATASYLIKPHQINECDQ
jgi:hypothetical protein